MVTTDTHGDAAVTMLDVEQQATDNFRKKLSAAIGDAPKALIARRAGILPQTLGKYLDGSAPAGHIALRLAKALDVDLIWLLDESRKEFPAPPFKSESVNLQTVRSRELLIELARRYHGFADTAYGLLVVLEGWDEVDGDDLKENAIDPTAVRIWRDLWDKGPKGHHVNAVDWAMTADIMQLAQAMTALAGFGNLDEYVGLYVSTLPPEKRDFEPDQLRHQALRDRLEKLRKAHPGFDSIGRYMTSKDAIMSKPDEIARHMAGACLSYLLTRPALLKDSNYNDQREALRKAGHIDGKGKPVYYLGDDIAGDIGIPPKLRTKHRNA